MTCATIDTFAKALDGELTANAARDLAAHADTCPHCRTEQARAISLVATLRTQPLPARDPSFVEDVLNRTARAPERSRKFARRVGQFAALATCAAAVVVVLHLPETPEDVVIPRGALNPAKVADRGLGFEAFVHAAAGAPVESSLHAGAALSTSGGLSFTVFNRTGAPTHYMLFAVDGRNEVHWFYPAYDGHQDALAPLLEATPAVQPLPDGVTPDAPAKGLFRVIGVFTKREVRVREIEALVGAGGLEAVRHALPDAVVQEIDATMQAPGANR